MGRDKLTFFLGPSAILRIFALGGGSLRLISQDSLVNFKVQLKKWLFVIMFALEGFLILILLAQTFFVTKKRTHKSDKFLLERLSYFISWFVPMDSLPSQPLGGSPPLRCGDTGIHRSKNHQFRKANNWIENSQKRHSSQFSSNDEFYRYSKFGKRFGSFFLLSSGRRLRFEYLPPDFKHLPSNHQGGVVVNIGRMDGE